MVAAAGRTDPSERAALYARLPLTAADRWWLDLAREVGGDVLELGAGAGRLTTALAETGASVTAVESDPAMLASLRARVGGAGGGPITVEAADVTQLPHGPAAMLVILPTSLLNELPDPAARRAAIAGAAQRCAPEGLVALHLLAPWWLHDPPPSSAGQLRPLDGGEPVEVVIDRGAFDRWRLRREATLTYRFPDGTVGTDHLDAAVVQGAELDDALAAAGLERVTGAAAADATLEQLGLRRPGPEAVQPEALAWHVLARPR